MQIPPFLTPRLLLRGFVPGDLEPLAAILGDREVIRFMPRTEPWPEEIVRKVMARQAAHWEDHGFGWYAVECREDGVLIGWCGLGVLPETGETEIKYLLKRSHWGRGLATEGATPCVRYGLEVRKLPEIVGLVHPENVPSQRVLEKLGLRFRNRASYFGMDLLRYTKGE